INRGYDVMPWCGRCGVGISEQEMKDGYRLVEHKACFIKFPLKNRPGENLLVWTTTPWTLTSNVGAAVNPDLTYLKVKLKGDTYEVVGEVKGAEMIGWEYIGPFDDLPAQKHEYGFPEEVAKITKQSGNWPAKTAAQSHKVIDGGKDVTETEGTGIVHTAPG